jgi:hypothetical protein
MALAWPVVLESQSHLRPGQSRGFQAKLGRNTTMWRTRKTLSFPSEFFLFFRNTLTIILKFFGHKNSKKMLN